MNKLNLRVQSLRSKLLVIAGLALVYFLSARLLISLSAVTAGPVTTIWLPSGIAVAALVLFGPSAAFGAFIGSLAVALHTSTPIPLALLLSVGNTGGELLCWWLLAGRGGRCFSIDGVADGPRLAGAALVAYLVSATLSVAGYVHFGLIPREAFLGSWLSWMGSGVASMVLVAPFLVYAARHAVHPWKVRGRWPEYGAALFLLLAGALLWQGPHFQRGVDEPVILLLILGQLWIAYRFAPAAMTLSNAVIAAFAVVALVLRLGEAPPATAYPFILSLQLTLVGLALVGFLLAAMVERQRRFTQQLQDAQGALVTGARDAGRAEIATNVLHNVGNVLNSVNVSAQLAVARLEASKVQGLSRAVQMLQANQADLGAYMTQDPKGRLLPAYLDQVGKALEQERRELREELGTLVENIDHIKDVVATQQRYAGVTTVLEPVQLQEVVEDALRLHQSEMARAGVTIVREYGEVPMVPLDKARIVQILVNLFSNARHAMAHREGERRMTLRVGQEDGQLAVRVTDEGEGISPENLTRIFAHGFTTRRGGHGFGLHSSALVALEMGGTLVAHSGGLGAGATFTLKLPVREAVPA
ncbi:MAG TPA: ATP-binding protein [Ramlibacter sp.]|nr:ATP-binding protein [Ramlibacter sp.]